MPLKEYPNWLDWPLIYKPALHDTRNCSDVPEWMSSTGAAFRNYSGTQPMLDAEPTQNVKCSPEIYEGDPLPEQPPTFTGPDGGAVARVRVDAITPAILFWQYAYPAIPLVLEGGFAHVQSWFDKHTDSVVRCAEQVLHERELEGLYDDREGQERCSTEEPPYCRPERDLQKVMRECGSAASWTDESQLPRVFDFHPQLALRRTLRNTGAGTVIYAKPGQRFGTTAHYDEGCVGSGALQYRGSKRWWLWNAWAYRGLAAHTRFEAVLKPGDLLIYPPAWHHTNVALDGPDSVSAVYPLLTLPWYGAYRNESVWPLTPLGFDLCAIDTSSTIGWRSVSAVWEHVLGPERLNGPADRAVGTAEPRDEL